MPTRYLKPGIRDSERIDSISLPDAEILYYRLLVSVDDFGRTDARPSMVKAACFPVRLRATADKCMQWLQELEKHGLLVTYEVGGKPYLQITKWDNKPRSEKSKFPCPGTDAYNRIQMLLVTETVTVTKTGTETDSSIERQKAPLSADDPVNGIFYIPLANKTEYQVTAELLSELEQAYPAVDGPATLKEIRAWCVTNPSKCKTFRGAPSFLNRWFEKVQNHG